MFRPDDSHLELLFAHGLGRGDGGPWHRRLGPTHQTPAQMLGELLRFAANNGFTDRVRLLLAHGVSPNPPGPGHPILHGRTPYELALYGGHRVAAELLAAAGAEVPELDPPQRVVAAAMAGDREAVEQLAAAHPGVVEQVHRRHPHLVGRAAAGGRSEAVRLLVELGWDVSARDRSTPLHEAVWRGDRPTAELLLALGADPLHPRPRPRRHAARLGRARRSRGARRRCSGPTRRRRPPSRRRPARPPARAGAGGAGPRTCGWWWSRPPRGARSRSRRRPAANAN